MSSDDGFAPRAGILLLRAFFGPFWILQFYFKLRNSDTGELALGNLWEWSTYQVHAFTTSTPLPAFIVRPYTVITPWVELVLGLLILVGFRTRWAIVCATAWLVSLDMGLMLQGKHEDVKSNTVLMLAMLLALAWAPFDSWSLDARTRR